MDVKDIVKKENKDKNNVKKGKYSDLFKLLLLVFIIGLVSLFVFKYGDGKVKMSAKVLLEKVVEKNDLQTVSYTYNAIAKQCKNDKCTDKSSNDDYKYFVAYEGIVTAGIDMEKVDVKIDKTNKKIILTIPEPYITGYNVPIESLNFIFTKEKYNESKELQIAHKLCKEDLEGRSNNEELILNTAKNNAILVLKEFYKPLIEKKYPKYDLEIK